MFILEHLKNTIEPELLRGIALGTFYASGRSDFAKANEFAIEFERMLGAMSELDDIYKGLLEFDQDFKFSEKELHKMTKYCENNLQKIWMSDRETLGEPVRINHDQIVRKSTVYNGLICYKKDGNLYPEGALNPIKKGFEPGESIIDFSQLEETTDKYDHILYRYNDGKFERVYKKGTEPEKIDSSEAGKQSQDDSPVGFEELLKLIDFEQVDRLNQIDELIKRVYPDGYPSIKYPDPRPTNPCANCSEWQRAQRTGEMLICNCTIPYMNQPYYGTWTFNIDRSGNTAQ